MLMQAGTTTQLRGISQLPASRHFAIASFAAFRTDNCQLRTLATSNYFFAARISEFNHHPAEFHYHVHSKRGKYHNRYGDRRPTHTTHIHHVAMYMCVDEEG